MSGPRPEVTANNGAKKAEGLVRCATCGYPLAPSGLRAHEGSAACKRRRLGRALGKMEKPVETCLAHGLPVPCPTCATAWERYVQPEIAAILRLVEAKMAEAGGKFRAAPQGPQAASWRAQEGAWREVRRALQAGEQAAYRK